jgi:hypothetical protein
MAGITLAAAPVRVPIRTAIHVEGFPYYATGNGVSDDTAAVQAAMNDAKATGIREVRGVRGHTYIVSQTGLYNSGDGLTNLPYCLFTGTTNLTADIELVDLDLKMAANQAADTMILMAGNTAASPYTGAVKLNRCTFDGNGVNQSATFTDHGLVTAAYADNFSMTDCVITGWPRLGAHVLRTCKKARIEKTFFDQAGIGSNGISSALRFEVSYGWVVNNTFVGDFSTAQGHIECGDNADITDQQIGTVFMGNQFHGGGPGSAVGLSGVVGIVYSQNKHFDMGASSSISVFLQHYIHPGGTGGSTIYDTTDCIIDGNEFYNCRWPIELAGGSGTQNSILWTGGVRRCAITNNIIAPSYSNTQTGMGGTAATYPTPHVQAYGSVVAVNLKYGIYEENRAGVGENSFTGNVIWVTGNSGASTGVGISTGSPMSNYADNIVHVVCSGNGTIGIDNTFGADISNCKVYCVSGTGTTTGILNAGGGWIDACRVYCYGTGTATGISTTGGKVTRSFAEVLNGTCFDQNSTACVLGDNQWQPMTNAVQRALSPIAAPATVTLTGQNAGTLTLLTQYDYIVVTEGLNGELSVPSSVFTNTLTGSQQQFLLTITNVTAAKAYHIFGRTHSGTLTHINRVVRSFTATTTTFTDTGSTSPKSAAAATANGLVTTVASANNLSLGNGVKFCHISGATQINLLDSSNLDIGAIVTLIFDGAPTVKNNQGASGVYKPILLVGAADFVASSSDVLMLVWDGTNWYEAGRSVI